MPKKTSRPRNASTPSKSTDSSGQRGAAELPKQHFIKKEVKRYQSKGFGLFFAILQVVLFYLYWPELMR